MERKLDSGLIVFLCLFLALHFARLLPPGTDALLLAIASILGTLPVVASAVKSVKNRKISVDLLASIALVASIITGEWASAAFINLMLASARIFGDYTDRKALAAIQGLMKFRPEKVKIKKDGAIKEIPAEKVLVGDIVVIESGDRIPVDGTIIEGQASVDQSSLTGESLPVEKKAGERALSSTLAVSGSLLVKAEKVGKDTTLEKIIGLVESSQSEKASIRTASDVFAKWYIIVMLILSVAVYFFSRDLALVLSLLLVACADDIAVAIPLAFLAAIGYAARRGVIVKGGAYLDGLTKVKTFVLDKTGTITRGRMKVEAAVPLNGFSENDLLKLAGATESLSEHPSARAIAEYVKEKGVKFKEPENFKETPGKGIEADSGGEKIYAGKPEFMAESGVKVSPADAALVSEAEKNGYSVTLFGTGGKLAGFVKSGDEIRPHVKDAIDGLKALGVGKFVMLTGDNELVAKRIAGRVGITDFHANLLPEDKIKYLKKYIGPGSKVAMVGDGVNDAASLALSDVGIAMGAIGSDSAIEAADIALMRDDFREIPELMSLGIYTRKIARQDFWIWGIVNALGLALVFGRIIGPQGSAAYNFVTDFIPLINSMRLFNLHLNLKP